MVIVINTTLLSLDSYPPNVTLLNITNQINMALSFIFIFEMFFKLFGIGFKSYFRDSFNIFDSVIVGTTIIDICLTLTNSTGMGGNVVTALRTFRLMRIFKLAKTWKKLHYLLKTIGATLKDVATFSILLALFIFTYTLVGLELFANKARYNNNDTLDLVNGSTPTLNFDLFLNAFTSVFCVLTNDSWQQMYYNYYRATTDGPLTTIFFISLVVMGQKILLNLFLAILLENFDETSIKQKLSDQAEEEQAKLMGLLKKSFVFQRLDKIKDAVKRYFDDCFKTKKLTTVRMGVISADQKSD